MDKEEELSRLKRILDANLARIPKHVLKTKYRFAYKKIKKEIRELEKEKFKCLDNFNDKTVLHYCTKQEMADAFEKYGGLDWVIGEEDALKELTADMAGFKPEKSQRVIIDYDKGFGKFLVRRSYMDYGMLEDIP